MLQCRIPAGNHGVTQRRLKAGDVTPTGTAQAEARLSRGLADLNAAEVNLAISQEPCAPTRKSSR
jgi:hypothetical protein